MIKGLKVRLKYLFKRIFYRPYLKEGVYGIKYYIYPYSSLDNQIVQRGVLDDWDFLNKIKYIIPFSGIAIDIGANVGFLSLLLASKFVKEGKVYAFEPDPENYRQLNINISLNHTKNILTFPIALQNDSKISQLELNIRRAIDGEGNLNRGLSSIKQIPLYRKKKIKVKASTLDEQVKALKLPRIDFIKVDVEGAESLVFLGAINTLKTFKPIIQYEYNNTLDQIMKENNTADTFYLLNNLGYRQFYINKDLTIAELLQPDKMLLDANVICIFGDKLL